MQYAWNVYQAWSQASSLRLGALAKPVVRLGARKAGQDDSRVIYRTDPLQRIVLSWAKDKIRLETWNIMQKAYHPQLGLGVDWCAHLLLFPSTKSDSEEEVWKDDSASSDMRSWIQAQGGRIENSKVFPS